MRALGHYLRSRFALLPLLEAAVLVQSVVLAFELRLKTGDYWYAAGHGAAFAAVMLLVMTAFGLYDHHAEPFRLTIQRVFSAYVVTLALGAMIFYFLPDLAVGRGVFALASLFGLSGLLVVRYAANRAAMLQLPSSRILVVGDGPEAEGVVALLQVPHRGRAPRFSAVFPISGDEAASSAGTQAPGRRPDVQDLLGLIRLKRVSEIVVALRDRRDGREPLDALLACRLRGVRVLDLVTFYEREQGLIKLEHLRTSWLVYGTGFDQGRLRAFVKRAFDLAASSVLVVVTSPIMVLAALAIRLEDGGPVLFRQERVRVGGATFTMFKFRSMRKDAEKDGTPMWAGTSDQRVTRVGRIIRRLRIDELPQLINVLRAEMSFVGPRPERPFFVARLAKEIPYYELRHNVRPGITGWAQVRLQYGASVEDAKRKLEYDLYYVKNHSLFLDLMILFETIQVVLLGKGAR